MKKHTTSTAIPTYALKAEALASMSASFERFCLAAGLETLSEMLEQDATAACGERHERGERRQAHRWGRTKGKIGFHGGKVEIERPRVRGLDGVERVLPSWENVVEGATENATTVQALIDAISPAVSNRTGTAFPLRSWKGSTRCSPSQGSASLTNCAARSPAPTSSRMSWARCAGSAATSNTGARPRWPSDGPPPPCRKQPRASVD